MSVDVNRCPKCRKRTLRKDVRVTISCPAGNTRLRKADIRRRDVEVVCVDWDSERLWCANEQCGWFAPWGHGP
jgi:hypothetical protein